MTRGRPRSFDPDVALQAAMLVFWRDGFRAASMAALTAAMGINKPSLYAAFGDKEQLYQKALARYAARHGMAHYRALHEQKDARRAVEACLRSRVDDQTDPARPRGCFEVVGSADCGTPGMPQSVDDALRSAVRAQAAMFEARLKRAVALGQLPPETDYRALGVYFATVASGLAVQARAGASRKSLMAVVDSAMAAWPPR